MIYSKEQQAQALFLLRELEQVELERSRQKVACPWLNWDELLDLISKRLMWPQGTAKAVLMEMVVHGTLIEHRSGRAVRVNYMVEMTQGAA